VISKQCLQKKVQRGLRQMSKSTLLPCIGMLSIALWDGQSLPENIAPFVQMPLWLAVILVYLLFAPEPMKNSEETKSRFYRKLNVTMGPTGMMMQPHSSSTIIFRELQSLRVFESHARIVSFT